MGDMIGVYCLVVYVGQELDCSGSQVFQVLNIYVVGSCGFVCFGFFDSNYGLVCCDDDGFMWEFTDASEDDSSDSLGFVWGDVGELFSEMVCFVTVGRSSVSVEVYSPVGVGFSLLVAKSFYGCPEFVGVMSVVPGLVKVLSP